MPAFAGSGSLQAGPFPVGNLLSYANSDFEGQANFIAVTNIGTISDSSTVQLHGSDSLKFTSAAAGTTALKLQEGSSATQITVKSSATYTLGGWFKLPAANSGESVTFGLGLYDSSGTWINWFSTSALTLNATSNWQYVEGTITVPSNAAWALDSPKVTLNNAAASQVTYMDMLAFKPLRGAQAIGAHGQCSNPCNYQASNWTSTNSTIGPLQSDKEFISGDLPSNFNQTVCYAIEHSPGMSQSNWPVCIIAYTGTLSQNDTTAQTDMNNFLANVPAGQELYIVWHQEPEGDSFSGEPGCGTDTGATAFVCEFERQSSFVHSSPDYGQNIFVAMNSAGSHYGDVTDDNSPGDDTASDGTSNGTTNCPYMLPNNNNSTGGADIYLVDFYQYSVVAGTNVNTESIREDNWKNWLSCATARNRPVGFGEYGLDESTTDQTGTCTNNPNDAAEAPNAMSADDTYLRQLPMSGQAELQNPVPVAMWAYWYSNFGGTPDCTVFTSQAAISTWQGIETANGGG